MSISAYLLSKGIENKIVDPKGLPGDTAFRNIVDNAALENPDVIGITCCATEIFEIKKLCREIKKRVPGTRIVLGGPHPTYRPDDFIRAEVDFDYIIRGEGEISFYKLTEALRKKEDPKSVDGLCIKTEKGIKNISEPKLIDTLDHLPLPAYSKVDMNYYSKPNVWAIRPVYISAVWVFTSRGCPFNCKFCVAHSVFGRTIRKQSPSYIIRQIKYLVAKYKIDAIFFGDECFTFDKDRVKEICRLMKKEKISIIWGCQTRPQLIDEEIIKVMKDAGCIQIDMGVESGSERILGIMNKKMVVADYIRAARLMTRYGIRQLANMMINIPGETLKDIDKSVRLLKIMRPNVVLWNVYNPIPGVNFGRELELKDLESQLDSTSEMAFEMIEKKYKFGMYEKKISEILNELHDIFPHPRYLKFRFDIQYCKRWLRIFSYLFDLRYIIKLFRSRRKKDYIRSLLSVKTQIIAK